MPPRRGFSARRYTSLPKLMAPVPVPEPGVKRKRGRPRKINPLPSVEVQPLKTAPPPMALIAPPWETLKAIPPMAGRTPAVFGTKLSSRLAHHFLMTHPVQFRRYMIPKVSPRGYWHRYAFSPVILASRQGDTILKAGRASGKSFSFLEPEIVQHALTHPGEESMLTSLRKIHIVDRMERVIQYFETPQLARYVKKILRSPSYMIILHNGHTAYGISVGDDPEAKMAQGKHVGLLVLEEAHQYPMRAWMKIQGSKDARGCRVIMIGVPDGRNDTPFRMADTQYPAFYGRRFKISREWDPYWDQATKAAQAVALGGVTSDLYKQEVQAEWGNPSWSAWDLENIYRCMTLADPPVVIRIDWPAYRDNGWGPLEALLDFPPMPETVDCMVAADIGYTQPTEIGVFVRLPGRAGTRNPWRLHCRIELVNRFEHDVQAKILWEIAQRAKAISLGIDTTEGEGRAIATEIDREAARPLVTRVNFTDSIFVGLQEDPESHEDVEVYELAKPFSTQQLRSAFKDQLFEIARDDQLVAEFNQEKESKTQAGVTLVRTPSSVHIPDMFRVAILTLFLRPTDDDAMDGFAFPEVGIDYARGGA